MKRLKEVEVTVISEAYLVFIGVIWAGSLLELTGGGVLLLNLAASAAYLSILVLELIRLKWRRWLLAALIVDCIAIGGFAWIDRFWAPAEVYLHWLDIAVLALGMVLLLIRSISERA